VLQPDREVVAGRRVLQRLERVVVEEVAVLEIGRAACSERGSWSVYSSDVDVQ
jgi:hypothetical protein